MWKKFDLESAEDSIDGLPIQIVRVQGYLDTSTFPKLQDHLQEIIEKEKYRIIVDFSDLNYISSAGLGVLMGMLQEVRQFNGDLKLSNMAPKIRNLFDMLGFSRLVRIYEDIESAKKAFLEEHHTSEGGNEEVRAEDNY
jgi:anti-sigma B factor antagonist